MPIADRSGMHVIFGAGQVGYLLAERLAAKGERVRVAKRSRSPLPEGVEILLGDAGDRDLCIDAARGASVVYHCMNPPYFAKMWAEMVPRYMENLIAAAAAARARLVVLDNLYMLGNPHGKPMNEDTPPNPCSRKGEVRARVAERLFQAHRAGDVRAVSGRASDFYGPRGAVGSHLGGFFWKPALKGGKGRVIVDPSAIHTYHYIPDVAAGLMALGTANDEDALGHAWMLPCTRAETLRQLVERMSRVSGRPLDVARIPRIAMRAMALFMPIMREMDEMMYQWEAPFIVDDSRFRARFDVLPTEADAAAKATVDWAITEFSR